MLEIIREYLMRRLQNKMEDMIAWIDNKLTHKINKLLEKYKIWSGGCYSTYAWYDEFEVTIVNGSKHAIHIAERTCRCRRYDLSGIHCYHAIGCLNMLGYNVEDYVDSVYYVENYNKAYSGIIFLWMDTVPGKKPNVVMKPLTIEKQPERTKKKRRPELPDIIVKEENGIKMLSMRTQLIRR